MGPDSMYIFNENLSQKISDNLSFKKFYDQQVSVSPSSKYSNSDELNNEMSSNNWGSKWYSRILNARILKNPEVQLSDYFLGSKHVLSRSLQVNVFY